MKKELVVLILLIILSTQIVFVYAGMIPASSVQGNKQDYNVEIKLVKGWNFIVGIPVWGEEQSAISSDSEIQQGDIIASFYYSRNENKYLQVYPKSEGADNYLLNAQLNTNEISYFAQSPVWIYSNNAGVLKYTRKDFPKFYANSKLSLTSGWNLVTILPEISSKTFNDIRGNCNAEKLYFYIGELNRWQSFDLNNSLFGTEDVGKGFLVKVTSNCTLGIISSSQRSAFNITPPTVPNLTIDSCLREVIILKEKTPQEFIQLNNSYNEFSYLNHEAILQEFYKNYKDNYDFMVVAPQNDKFQSHYSFPLNYNITGIGEDNPQSSIYTSRLMSFVLFDYYQYYTSFNKSETKPPFSSVFIYTIYHEIAHHWCCQLDGIERLGSPHWSDNVDLFGGSSSYIDIMGYKEWVIENGENKCIENGDLGVGWKFSNLTLYLMGLLDKSSVKPIKINYAESGASCWSSPANVITDEISIEEIIFQNGVRVPNVQQSKKNFNIVFLDIVPYGVEVDYEYIKSLKEYMRSDEWYASTNHKSNITFCN